MMIKHRTPPRALIPRLVREARMVPRPGALELLKALETAGIPVIIVSAGLSDVPSSRSRTRARALSRTPTPTPSLTPSLTQAHQVIEEWLRQHGALSENLAICSNRLNYDAVTLT